MIEGGDGHGTAVDWWSLGMVVYEMLTGLPPWYTTDRAKLFQSIRTESLSFPSHVSPKPRAVISALLQRDVSVLFEHTPAVLAPLDACRFHRVQQPAPCF